MDNKSFYLALLGLFVLFYLLLGISKARGEEKQMTACRLASQLLEGDTRICIFVGANHTQYREYVPYDAGECPREYQCPYRPNEKPFDLKSVIRSIKDQFRK
jgi:hypothetical protein|tara:strand:+ start:619 stop:924 length:306 start_codon:yes stop_codon:yes gene_type:complete